MDQPAEPGLHFVYYFFRCADNANCLDHLVCDERSHCLGIVGAVEVDQIRLKVPPTVNIEDGFIGDGAPVKSDTISQYVDGLRQSLFSSSGGEHGCIVQFELIEGSPALSESFFNCRDGHFFHVTF